MRGGRGGVSSIARVMEMRIGPKTPKSAYPNAASCAGFGTKIVGVFVYFVLNKM